MSALEMIARLNPKATNYLGASSGGGGAASFANESVAGALAGVKHPMGSTLLRAMYAGHDKSKLESAWERHIRAVAAKHGWKARNDTTLTRLALATVNEHMDCRCRDCMGRGIRRRRVGKDVEAQPTEYFEGGYLVVTCATCNGTGKGAQNASVRGRLLNMKPNSYNETWHERYEMLLGELVSMQRTAEDEFHRHFKG
jgi:hypothetical protein